MIAHYFKISNKFFLKYPPIHPHFNTSALMNWFSTRIILSLVTTDNIWRYLYLL